MEAILILWLWNAGELALTSIEIRDVETCNVVLAETLETMNATKRLKGMNRDANGVCIEIPKDSNL